MCWVYDFEISFQLIFSNPSCSLRVPFGGVFLHYTIRVLSKNENNIQWGFREIPIEYCVHSCSKLTLYDEERLLKAAIAENDWDLRKLIES